MGTRPEDTSEAAWSIMTEGYAGMSATDRVRRAVGLTALANAFALAEIRRQHPDEDARTHRLRLAARTIDPETMKAAFGWSLDE